MLTEGGCLLSRQSSSVNDIGTRSWSLPGGSAPQKTLSQQQSERDEQKGNKDLLFAQGADHPAPEGRLPDHDSDEAFLHDGIGVLDRVGVPLGGEDGVVPGPHFGGYPVGDDPGGGAHGPIKGDDVPHLHLGGGGLPGEDQGPHRKGRLHGTADHYHQGMAKESGRAVRPGGEQGPDGSQGEKKGQKTQQAEDSVKNFFGHLTVPRGDGGGPDPGHGWRPWSAPGRGWSPDGGYGPGCGSHR